MAAKKIALTPVFQKLDAAHESGHYNVFVLEGGSRSSKTHSIIQFWIKYAEASKGKNKRVIVSRLKGTWLTATVVKDFLDILKDYGLYDKRDHNKSTGAGIYKLFDTEFWFLGLDDEQRIHGMKSDAFWINEAVEASFNDYAQLMQRCSGFAVLDYNPSFDEHWIYDKICKRPRTCYMHSTMLDNPLIPDNAKEQILSYEDTPANREAGTVDKRKWEIYGLGKRASLEGLIYNNWEIIKEMPDWVTKRGYGQDWGFVNDQSATVDCAFADNVLYVDELCYKTHMVTRDIINFHKTLPRRKVIADIEPRLVTEVRSAGINIYAVIKGAESVVSTIDVIQGYKIMITERSINLIKEIKNYTWQFNEKTNKYETIVPKGQDDHTLDAFRYWIRGEIMGKVKQTIDLTGVF